LRPSAALVLLLAAAGLPGCGGDSPTEPNPSPTPSGPTDVWVTLAPLGEPRQETGVAALQSRVYAAGGFRPDASTSSTLEVYDPARNAWTFAAPMPVAANHPGAAAVNDRLYVIGGANDRELGLTAVQEYDPSRNEWRLRAPMPTGRNAPVVFVADGRIYVAGGAPAGRAFEVYDPRTDTWQVLPAMPTARNHLAGGAAAGRLFAVGGRPPNTLAVNEAYGLMTGVWTTQAPLPTGRSGHGAAVVRGCLYVIGGEGNPARPDGVFPQNEVYDPRTNTWESRTPMLTPRHGIGAAVLGDRIYLPGGGNVQGLATVGVHEAYVVPAGKSCE
jgi:N-acetylneuraminic acid mutarotase